MPENIKITAEELKSANEPKGKRKIKFAQRSFLAFKAGRMYAMELKQKALEQQYTAALDDLKNTAKEAQAGKVVNPSAVLAQKVSRLEAMGVKIAKLDIDFRRLEQQTKPKPIKLGKGFIENIKKTFRGISDLKREKEQVDVDFLKRYNTAQRELMDRIKSKEPISDMDFSVFSTQTETTKKSEPAKKDNASSLFANMRQPVAKSESKSSEPNVDETTFVPPVYQPDAYNAFSQQQAPYIGGVQHVFELPPAPEKNINAAQSAANNTSEVSPMFALPPASEKKNSDGANPMSDVPYIAPTSSVFDPYIPKKGNQEKQDNFKYDKGPLQDSISRVSQVNAAPIREVIKPSSDSAVKPIVSAASLGELSTEDIQRQMQQLQAELEARDKQKKADLEAQSISNHEYLSTFTRDFYQKDEFNFTPSELADIERQESERAAMLERERAERILTQKKKEVFDAILGGQLSPEKMEVYITEGILTVDDIKAKMQDNSLTAEQAMSLAGAEWLAKKMTAEETVLSESSSKTK